LVYAYKIKEYGKGLKIVNLKQNLNFYVVEPALVLKLTYEKNLLNYNFLKLEKENKINQFKNLKLNLNLLIKKDIDFLKNEYLNNNYLKLNSFQKVTFNQLENQFKTLNNEKIVFNILKVPQKENHFKRLLWLFVNYQNKFKHIETLKSDIEKQKENIKQFQKVFNELDLRINPAKSESKILNFKDVETLKNGKLSQKAKETLFFYFTNLKKIKGNHKNILTNWGKQKFKNNAITETDINFIINKNLKFAYEQNLKNLNLRFSNIKNKVQNYI
jgi:hypothetical protein